jgi:DNA-binding GntR family transcriptional regulator
MLQTKSPADLAYERIKQAILELTYRPGAKLSEMRLATDLGVGRSPVRSALSRLESEGWVNIAPQSGTFVRDLDTDELEQLSELRCVLEVHATRAATPRISERELADLRKRFDALKRKSVERNIGEFTTLDTLFHGTIYRAAGNARIEGILLNLKDQISWVRAVTATLPGRVTESLLEMDAVLAAMEERNARGAANAMEKHIKNIASNFKSLPAASSSTD